MSRTVRTTLASAAAVLALVAGSLVAAAPAQAAVGGTVTGVVSIESAPGVFVSDPGTVVDVYSLFGDGEIAASTVTGVGGEFTVSGLPQGYYRFHFSGGPWEDVTDVWLGGTPHESASAFLGLGESDTSVFETRYLGKSISGTVTFADGPGPTAAAAAFLFNDDTGQWERQSWRAITDNTGAYEIPGLADGTYLLRFGDVFDTDLLSTEYWDDADYVITSTLIDILGADITGRNATLSDGGIEVIRVAGGNRFETAVEIAEQGWGCGSGCLPEAVFIVNGLNFPDALSAGPAAASVNAPILLATPTSLPAATAAALEEIEPGVIFVVGGTSTISASVMAQLEPYASEDVIRLDGPNRYATSLDVAETIFGASSIPTSTAYIATGTNFPDALGAGAAAGNEFAPLILVNGAATTIDDETADLLHTLGVSRVVIAGGTGAVSTSLEQSIAALPFINEVYRRSGANRYDTANKIAKGSFPLADGVFLATGVNFPDALAGAALAGNFTYRNPVYLVQPNCIPIDVLEEIQRVDPKEVYLLGGTATLGGGVQTFTPC